MRSILRSVPASPSRLLPRPTLRQPAAPRAFTSARPLRLKEETPPDPQAAEDAKQAQIKKQEQGKGEWHRDLASSSEERVKADREQVGDTDQHLKDLQEKTAAQSEKNHPKGKAGQ